MFACREAERLPYERAGGWTDSPGSGALEEGTVTTPQSALLTAPLTRGALGAAAPVQRYGGVKREGGKAGAQ